MMARRYSPAQQEAANAFIDRVRGNIAAGTAQMMAPRPRGTVNLGPVPNAAPKSSKSDGPGGLLGGFLKALSILDIPGSAMRASASVTAQGVEDLLGGNYQTGLSKLPLTGIGNLIAPFATATASDAEKRNIGETWKQAEKDFWDHKGTGTYLQEAIDKKGWQNTPLNNEVVKKVIGGAGDIGLDPLTYLGASGVAKKSAASLAGRALTEEQIAKSAAKFVASESDDALRAAAERAAESASKRGGASVAIGTTKDATAEQIAARLAENPLEVGARQLAWEKHSRIADSILRNKGIGEVTGREVEEVLGTKAGLQGRVYRVEEGPVLVPHDVARRVLTPLRKTKLAVQDAVRGSKVYDLLGSDKAALNRILYGAGTNAEERSLLLMQRQALKTANARGRMLGAQLAKEGAQFGEQFRGAENDLINAIEGVDAPVGAAGERLVEQGPYWQKLVDRNLDPAPVRQWFQNIAEQMNAAGLNASLREYFPRLPSEAAREGGRRAATGEYGKTFLEIARELGPGGKFMGETLKTGTQDEIKQILISKVGPDAYELFNQDVSNVLSVYGQTVGRRLELARTLQDLERRGVVAAEFGQRLADNPDVVAELVKQTRVRDALQREADRGFSQFDKLSGQADVLREQAGLDSRLAAGEAASLADEAAQFEGLAAGAAALGGSPDEVASRLMRARVAAGDAAVLGAQNAADLTDLNILRNADDGAQAVERAQQAVQAAIANYDEATIAGAQRRLLDDQRALMQQELDAADQIISKFDQLVADSKTIGENAAIKSNVGAKTYREILDYFERNELPFRGFDPLKPSSRTDVLNALREVKQSWQEHIDHIDWLFKTDPDGAEQYLRTAQYWSDDMRPKALAEFSKAMRSLKDAEIAQSRVKDLVDDQVRTMTARAEVSGAAAERAAADAVRQETLASQAQQLNRSNAAYLQMAAERSRKSERILRQAAQQEDRRLQKAAAIEAQALTAESKALEAGQAAVTVDEWIQVLEQNRKHMAKFRRDVPNGFRSVGGYFLDAEIADSLVPQISKTSDSAFFKHYDQFVNWLKAWQMATPGFHVRNSIGAAWNNMVAGMNSEEYARFSAAWAADVLTNPEQSSWLSRNTARAVAKVLPKPDDATMELYAQVRSVMGRDAGQFAHEYFHSQPGRKGFFAPWSSNFAPLRASQAVGSEVEFNVRGALMMDRLRKGSSVDEALDEVARFHFDYEDITSFERNAVKRVIPFYTWTRKNVPLQLEMLTKEPAKFAMVWRAYDSMKPDEPVPEYFMENLSIRVPGDVPLVGGMYYTPDLPPVGAIRYLSDPVGETKSSLAVPIKTPLEYNSGSQFFKGIRLPDTPPRDERGRAVPAPESWTRIPFLMDVLGATGKADFADGKWYMSVKDAYAVEQGIPLLARLRRQFPSEPKYQRREASAWAGFLFGQLRTNDPTEMRNIERAKEYERKRKERERRNRGY